MFFKYVVENKYLKNTKKNWCRFWHCHFHFVDVFFLPGTVFGFSTRCDSSGSFEPKTMITECGCSHCQFHFMLMFFNWQYLL